MENITIKKERESSIEILRILLMIWIIGHHLVSQSNIEALFSLDSLSLNTFFSQLLFMGGKLGLNCFVIISGYFSLNKHFSFKKLLRLWVEFLLYSVILELIFLVCRQSSAGWGEFWKTFFPVIFNLDGYVAQFIILLCLSPIINFIIKKLPRNLNLVILFVMIFYFSILPTAFRYDTWNYTSWMILLYYTGACLKLYDRDFKNKTIIFGVLSLICFTLIIFSIITGGTAWWFYLVDPNKTSIYILAILIFMFVKSIKPFYNKKINIISSSSLGILLLHTHNPAMRDLLWIKLFKIEKFFNSWFYIPYCLILIVGVFGICFLIDHFIIKKAIDITFDFGSKKFNIIKNKINNNQENKFIIFIKKVKEKIVKCCLFIKNNITDNTKKKAVLLITILTFGILFSFILYYHAIGLYSREIFYALLFIMFAIIITTMLYLSNEGYIELKNLLPVGFMLFIIGLYCIWTYNKNFPTSEGWYTVYAEYILSGKVPYVDFELLFPPVYTYIITIIVAIFGNQIIILRIVGVLLLLSTSYLIYKIFKYFVNPYMASICSIACMFLMQSQVGASIYYDYINFYNLFNYLGIYYLIKYYKNDNNKNILKLNNNLFYAGIHLSIALLIRQSSGLINIVFAICLLAFIIIIKNRKSILNQFVSFGGGIAVPIILLSLFMIFNGSFIAFIVQTLIVAPSAKGGVENALFRWVEYTFTVEMLIICIVCVLAFSILMICGLKYNKNKEISNDFDQNSFKIFAGLLTFIFISILLFSNLNWTFYSFGAWDLTNILYMFSMVIFFGYSIYAVVKYLIGKEITSFDCILITLSGFVFFTQFGSCTSGGTSQGQGALSIGLVLTLICVCCNKVKINLTYKYVLVGISTIFCISCFTRVNVNSYNWWGLLQGNYYDQQYTIDNSDTLKGLKVSQKTKEMYEGIINTVQSDLNENDKIYCFSQIPIFYTLNNTLPCGTQSIVPWFDVSSQDTLAKDLEYIKHNPPKYIIVAYPPDWVIGGHENAFNSNQSSIQREFLSYFNAAKENGLYMVTASYDMNADTGGEYYPIEVLKYVPNYEDRNDIVAEGLGNSYDYLALDSKSSVLALSSQEICEKLPVDNVYNVESYLYENFDTEYLYNEIINKNIKYLLIHDNYNTSKYINTLYDLYSTNLFNRVSVDEKGTLYELNHSIFNTKDGVYDDGLTYDDGWIQKSYIKTFNSNLNNLYLKIYLPSFIGNSKVKIIVDGSIYEYNFDAQDNAFFEINASLSKITNNHTVSIMVENDFVAGDNRQLGAIISDFNIY